MNIVDKQTFDVILVGVHGSGKTTLGRQLARDLGVRFDAELGREAMERRGPARATVDAGEDFDAMVWAEEEDRDQGARQELRGVHGVRRVVETWHIGNAAYAILRPGTSTRRDWRSELAARLAGHDVPLLVQRLHVDRPTFDRRYSEHRGAREDAQRRFLWSVGEVLDEIIADLARSGEQATILPPLDTSAFTVRAAGDAILAALPPWTRSVITGSTASFT